MLEKIIRVNGSKSEINRILLISTFLEKELKINNFSDCEDVETLLSNLISLGFNFKRNQGNSITIIPNKLKSGKLYIKDSGTALRFIISRLAVCENEEFILDCSEQLKKRPHEILITSLKQLGAELDNNFPMKITGKKLTGGMINVQGNISSQFISSLLLLAPAFEGGLEIVLNDKIVSKSYIDLTIALMGKFGVSVKWDKNKIIVPKNSKYKNLREYFVEPDYSTLSYFWLLAVILKKNIVTQGNPQNSLQADSKFIHILERFGAKVKYQEDSLIINCDKILGGNADMIDMPDQVISLVILALFAETPISISGVEHLKFKESDRITNLVNELSKLTKIKYENEILTVFPIKKIPQDEIMLRTYNDHRFVMAFSVLQKKFEWIKLDNIDAVKKSAPEFWNELKKI